VIGSASNARNSTRRGEPHRRLSNVLVSSGEAICLASGARGLFYDGPLMATVPPIYKFFEELSTDERFDDLGLELRRNVSSISSLPRYEIRVMTSASGDVAAYATLIAALGDFARERNLDSDMNSSWVTLTPRSSA
jgi:hypothetical protein